MTSSSNNNSSLAICIIVRNEATYILEWLAYHRVIGVQEFYFFDHESTDETSAILSHLEAEGMLTRIPWVVGEHTSPQFSAYKHMLSNVNVSSEFIAFIDADEFITLVTHESIAEYLSEVPREAGAIAINQRVFGSSGHRERGPGLVIERFPRCAPADYEENRWFKSICRKGCATDLDNSHQFRLVNGQYFNGNLDPWANPPEPAGKSNAIAFKKIMINHYLLKSWEEFLAKRVKGAVSVPRGMKGNRYRDDAFFTYRDNFVNETTCDYILHRLSETKSEIAHLSRILGQSVEPRLTANV
jgi:hypothetical protein